MGNGAVVSGAEVNQGQSTGAVATTGLMGMVMAWLPVEMTASAGLRAEELVTTPHGCGFLNGTGTARAGALKQNCCHGCLREGPLRSMPVALQGAWGQPTSEVRFQDLSKRF